METEKKNTEKRFNIYEMVTKRILQQMMQGEIPWRKTYSLTKKVPEYFNAATGKKYSFLNGLLLGAPGAYATMKQINAAGGRVKKGARSRVVVYWGSFIPKEYKEEEKRLKAEGKDTSHLEVWFLKGYNNVFSVDDVEGATFKNLPENGPETQTMGAESPTDLADMTVRTYTASHGVTVVNDDTRDPFYDADEDTVFLPGKDRFQMEEDYYASLFTNLVHSTAAESRLNRKREYQSMKDRETSAKEALIADMASWMIMSSVGLEKKETQEQTAADCQRWIEEMNNNYRLIVEASSGAEKAARYVLGKYADILTDETAGEENESRNAA